LIVSLITNSSVISITWTAKYILGASHLVFNSTKGKNFLNKSCIFFEDLLLHNVSRPHTKCRFCSFHLRSSPGRSVGIVNFKKMKRTKVGWPSLALCAYKV